MNIKLQNVHVLLTVLLMSMAGLTVQAQNVGDKFESGGLYYKIIDDNSVSVEAKNDEYPYWDENNELSGAVNIPETVSNQGNTYTVTQIGMVVAYCGDVTSISIPNTVTKIGDDAFHHCYGLTTIDIPNSVTEIGEEAFTQSGLVSIVLPNSVTSIGEKAFFYTMYLTSVTLSDGITNIPNGLFKMSEALTNVTLPNALKVLGKMLLTVVTHCCQ